MKPSSKTTIKATHSFALGTDFLGGLHKNGTGPIAIGTA